MATAARFQEQLQSALEGHQGEVQQLVASHKKQLAEQEAAYQARAAVGLALCYCRSLPMSPCMADVITYGVGKRPAPCLLPLSVPRCSA